MFIIKERPLEGSSLPRRNQVVVWSEFLGKGHSLEAKKREGRLVRQKHDHLVGQVSHLDRAVDQTTKRIRNQQRHLGQILQTRMRHQDSKDQKDRLRNQQMGRSQGLKQRLLQMKVTNRARLKKSVSSMLEDNRREYAKDRKMQVVLKKQMNEDSRKDLQMRMNSFERVNHSKYLGLIRMVGLKGQKNKESLADYNRRIKQEEDRISLNMQDIQRLQQSKAITLEKLKDETELSQRLKQTIDRANQVGQEYLESTFRDYKSRIERTLAPISTSNRSRINNSFSEDYDIPNNLNGMPEVSREQRINRTIDLVQRSGIFGFIEKGQNPQNQGFNSKRKRRHKALSNRGRRP